MQTFKSTCHYSLALSDLAERWSYWSEKSDGSMPLVSAAFSQSVLAVLIQEFGQRCATQKSSMASVQ